MFLKKGNIELRELVSEDAQRLAELADNYNIWKNVRDYFPHPYSETNAVEFIEFTNNEESRKNFAIIYEDELVGICGLILQDDIYKHSAEMGYWLGEDYWNKGITTVVIKLLLQYAFKDLHLTRIFAKTFGTNRASQKVLENNGFVLEAVMQKAIIKENQLHDEHYYAILNKGSL